MQHRHLRFYERVQIEVGIRWQLFPTTKMSWREWFFSPYAGVTLWGQEITSRNQLPESTQWSVDTFSVSFSEKDKKFYSNVFWASCALRVLGLDVGAGVFIRFTSDEQIERLLNK